MVLVSMIRKGRLATKRQREKGGKRREEGSRGKGQEDRREEGEKKRGKREERTSNRSVTLDINRERRQRRKHAGGRWWVGLRPK